MGSSFPKPKLPFFAPKDIKVSFKQENSQSKKRILKHIKISILFGLRKMLLWKKRLHNAGCPGQTLLLQMQWQSRDTDVIHTDGHWIRLLLCCLSSNKHYSSLTQK